MTKIKVLIIVICTLLLQMNLQAQYAPNFINMSFYNASSGLDDLHFDFGWTRNHSNVYLDGVNMKALPSVAAPTLWFQTVAMQLSGTDVISFNHLLSNVGGGGTKTLTVSIIDTMTLAETVVNTVAYANASQQTSTAAAVALTDVGIYWIKFTFVHTGSYSSNPVFEINSFVTTTTPVFLPVVLSKYVVNEVKGGARLDWTTISETNSGHFELYRSEDATNYDLIAFLAAQGESHSTVNYNYLDFGLFNHVSDYFYRLVQVDLNGEKQDFGVVRLKTQHVNLSGPVLITTINNSNILVTRQNKTQLRTEILIEIKDILGNTVISDMLHSGENKKVINTSQLSSGIYLAGNATIGFQKLILTKQMSN